MIDISEQRFGSWLLIQPKDRTYEYHDNCNCMIAQFIKETTGHIAHVGGTNFDVPELGILYQRIPDWLYWIVAPSQYSGDRSFGMVQEQFRKMFPEIK